MDKNMIREGFVGQRMITLPSEVKKRLKANPVTRFFHLTDLGFYPNARNHYRARKKGAREYIFIYCTEGSGWVDVDGERVIIPPNHYVIIPKKTRHAYGACDGGAWSIYWLHFMGDAAEHLYGRYRDHDQRAINVPYLQWRIDRFNAAYDTFSESLLENRIEYACLSCLDFLKSLVYRNVQRSVVLDQHESMVQSVRNFLLGNLNKSFDARYIAAQFEYSSSHLAFIFKKHTGYSIINFFNLKKVQKACEYLAYTNLSIKEVGHRVAFDDPLYFSRVFKKYMGVSPREYRRVS